MGLVVSSAFLDINVESEIKIGNLFLNIANCTTSLLKIKESFYFDVTITNSKQMQIINNLHRKINKHTDVLSFAFHDVKPQTNLLGEIFINWDDVFKQSKINKTSIFQELAILCIHGLLHLLKYDHLTAKGYKMMNDLQNKIMKELNLYI